MIVMEVALFWLIFVMKEMIMTLRSVLVEPRVFKPPFPQCWQN